MAKERIWVYVLDNSPIIADLTDINGCAVSTIEKGGVYFAEDTHPDISNDGSTKLFHSKSGVIQPDEIDYMVDKYNTVTPPSGFADPTISAVSDSGFTVNWVAPSGGSSVDNYEVTVTDAGVDITGSPFTMAGTTLKKVVSGLSTATEYKTKVKAINAGGDVTTNEVTVTTNA